MNRKNQEFLYSLPHYTYTHAHIHTQTPTSEYPLPEGTLVTTWWTHILTSISPKAHTSSFALSFSTGSDRGWWRCVRPYSIVQNSFTTLKILCALPFIPASRSWSFAVSIVLPFTECHRLGTTEIGLSNWLLSLGTHFKIPSCLFMNDTSSFQHWKIFHILSICCLDGLPFNYLPTEGHLGDFQVCAIMSQAAVNIHVGFCVDICFQLLWQMAFRSTIVGSYGMNMLSL